MDHRWEGRVGSEGQDWQLRVNGVFHSKRIFVIPETKGINTLQVNKYILSNSCSFVFLYAWKKKFLLFFLSFLLPSPQPIIFSTTTPPPPHPRRLSVSFSSVLLSDVSPLKEKKKKKLWWKAKECNPGPCESLSLHTPCSLTWSPFIWAQFATERKHRVILRYLTLIYLYQWPHL